MFRNRLFFKLFGASFLIILAATVSLDVAARVIWAGSLERSITADLKQKAEMLAADGANVAPGGFQAFAREKSKLADARVTIIGRDGIVLGDSESEPERMENHAHRPEVQAALNGQTGSSSRTSATVGVQYLYLAVPFKGGVLRLAYPLAAIAATMRAAESSMLIISLLLLALAALASAMYTRAFSRRIAKINQFAGEIAAGHFGARIEQAANDELDDLAHALNRTAGSLAESFTELEYSRARLETVLNSMQEGVLAITPDKRIAWENGRMHRLLGVQARPGAALIDLVRDPDLLSTVEQTLATGEVRSGRSQMLLPGRSFQITTAPMPGGGAVAVLEEITQIERVEKTRRDFIANVSHELRTPLTSIQGYTETLLEGAAAESRSFLEVIRKNVIRMERLTADLLALARVESGEDKLQLSTHTPAELIDDAVSSFAETARVAGQSLRVEVSTSRKVKADADKLHQVFANLLENALKYGASPGGVALGARDAGPEVEFFVRDQGKGIASEHLPRIFERLYRADNSRSQADGTGLGLAIAKHIVLKHGGNIWAESELGRGTTVSFTLPAE